jgi:hypothetical protein
MTSKSTKKESKYLNKWKVLYFATALTGIMLLVLEISIYRVTIIEATIPISIIFSVGVLTFFINKKHYAMTYNIHGVFFPLMQNIVSWGFIACYLFMATNYYLADNDLHDLQFEIKSKSSISGPRTRRHERKPLVTIDYFGFKKELVFKYKDTEKVEKAQKIDLRIKKGLLGFDIVDYYDTVDTPKNGKINE